MANETSEEHGSEPLARRSNSVTRHVLLAGIAGACLMGAGAGLWARPADHDQPKPTAVAKTAAASKPRGKLEIVLNDAGNPLAPPSTAHAPAITGPTVSAELIEPAAAEAPPLLAAAPPQGLMRVQDTGPQPVEPLAVEREAKAEKAKAEKARLEKARLQKAKLEKAKVEKLRLEKVKAEAKKKTDLKVARAEKPEKLKDVRVAEDAGIEVADTRQPGRLSRLKSVIAKPFKARKDETLPAADTSLAKADTAKPKTVKLAKAEAPKTAKKPSKRCVSSDPGEAIVCADPGLAAADRQLSRAYREAEAAGVPAWQLKQQQQRWIAARAAAAREAPWAVHDVYLARIAELNDMTRDARQDY
jgi:uncharacterized protein YecT (DUF1311 family)